jgi:hypothetical protein
MANNSSQVVKAILIKAVECLIVTCPPVALLVH